MERAAGDRRKEPCNRAEWMELQKSILKDFNGKYYSFQISIGKTGQINTIYNVNEIKMEVGSPKALIGAHPQPVAANVGLTTSANIISESGEKKQSFGRKNAQGEEEKNSYSLKSPAPTADDLLSEDAYVKYSEKQGKTKAAPIQNKHLNISAQFSQKSLHESLSKQKGAYGNMRALLAVFRETYGNAVPVMVQGDRCLHTVKDVTRVKAFTYLLGGFRYGNITIPVQFEIKQSDIGDDSLYVVATIKEDAIITTPASKHEGNVAPASSTVNIARVIELVKPEDARILSNIPRGMLNAEQRTAKAKGLKEKGEYLRRKAANAETYKNGAANLTAERIDAEIKNYGAKFNKNYSKAYMTYISPSDYIALTTSNAEKIQEESRVMVVGEMCEETAGKEKSIPLAVKNAGLTPWFGDDAGMNSAFGKLGKSAAQMERDGVKWAIKEFEKNGRTMKYVQADRQVIHGNDPKQWGKQVEDYINNTIRNGKDVTVYSENGVPLTITKDTAGKATYWNTYDNMKRYSDEDYGVKLRIETQIDEAAQVSKGKGKQEFDTKSHSIAKNGWNYRTAYFEDFDGQYYSFQISVGKSGKINTIYNVNEIKEAESPNTLKGAHPQSEAANVGFTTSTDIISESEEKYNRSEEKKSL